ncbi:MAG: penicillin-binding protein 2, partial [Patescibacteria group bacterium]
LLSAFGSIIISRLFFLQVVSRAYYETLAERQHVSSLDASIRRGNVYLREKDGGLFTVATIKSGHLAYIDPRKIKDAENIYSRLSQILPDLDKKDFLTRASKTNDPFEVVARRLEDDIAEKIIDLNLSGVGISPEEWRFYPAGNLASSVVGFAGYKGDDVVGRYGIEYSQESILKGEDYYLDGRQTLAGTFLDWGKKLFPGVKSSGSVVLTIEPQTQLFLEKILDDAFVKWEAERAGAVVIDPQTGRIIAMAFRPTFDPNHYGAEKSLDVFINPAIEHVYELGSTFKPLTMAAGVDLGKVSPKTTYFDAGYLIINGRRIENYDGKGRGTVDMQTVLNESLNTGAVFAMRQIGVGPFKDYLYRFGLADKTGIELPGEVAGNLANLESGREIESATASFGQGVAVTPLAFLRAVSALANGGKLVRPFIIEKILFDGAPDAVTEPQIKEGSVKPQTSEEITRMLVKVVDEALVGGTLKNEHYSIAAKTGTAQLPSKSGPGYSDEYLHSFFGYAPAYNAKFAIVMFLVKPQGARYASQTLSEPFMETMKFLLNYYNVPPDR